MLGGMADRMSSRPGSGSAMGPSSPGPAAGRAWSSGRVAAKAVFEQCERALPIGLGVAGEASARAAIVVEDGLPDVAESPRWTPMSASATMRGRGSSAVALVSSAICFSGASSGDFISNCQSA